MTIDLSVHYVDSQAGENGQYIHRFTATAFTQGGREPYLAAWTLPAGATAVTPFESSRNSGRQWQVVTQRPAPDADSGMVQVSVTDANGATQTASAPAIEPQAVLRTMSSTYAPPPGGPGPGDPLPPPVCVAP